MDIHELSLTLPSTSSSTSLSVSDREKALVAHLDLDQNQILSDYESAMAVSKVFQGSFDPNVTASEIDMEYAERKGILYIPRLIKHDEMNRFVAQETQVRRREVQFFAQEDRPLRMTISDPGSLDSLVFVDDSVQATPLGSDEIQVGVMAIGLNFKDVMIAMGQLPSANLGQECSGIVSAVGNDVSEFAVDDRVSITTVGTFSTYTRCPATSAHKMAEDMSLLLRFILLHQHPVLAPSIHF